MVVSRRYARYDAFSDQVLPFDTAAAEHYATIASSRERAGKPIRGFDALIAAVCRSRAAALATRNLPDFEGTGVEVMDPWAAASRSGSISPSAASRSSTPGMF